MWVPSFTLSDRASLAVWGKVADTTLPLPIPNDLQSSLARIGCAPFAQSCVDTKST